MSTSIKIINPFNPNDNRILKHDKQTTIRQMSICHDMQQPFIAYKNNDIVLQKDWDYTLCDSDQVTFFPLLTGRSDSKGSSNTRGIVKSIIGLGIAIAGFATGNVALGYFGLSVLIGGVGLVGTELSGDDNVESSKRHTLKGNSNQASIGDVIPVLYGRTKTLPSYAQTPYQTFENDDQYLHSLFVIGQGEYTIHHIFIGDTNISQFEDTTFQIINPNDNITLFDLNYYTVKEIKGQEFKADKQPSGVTSDIPTADIKWIGNFTLNPLGTALDEIEIDIVLPNGFGYHDGTSHSAKIRFEYRALDDEGLPIIPLSLISTNGWVYLGLTTVTGNSKEVIRKTVRHTNFSRQHGSRAQIRAGRITYSPDRQDVYDTILWAGCKGILLTSPTYSDLTMLAVKMKATEQLTRETANKISVVSTRKIRSWHPTTLWSSPSNSQSLVWAVVDILTNTTYGSSFEESRLNLQALYDLDQVLISRDDTFNYIYDKKTTTWEALKVAGTCARCTPIIQTGIFRLIRDKLQTIPTMLFTPRNIIKDSFTINYVMPDDYLIDGVNVEYIDDVTFNERHVSKTATNTTPSNPQEVKLLSIGNSAQAKREALYLSRVMAYRRRSITFKTELEGNICTYGDLIAVSHDMTDWANSGIVLSIVDTIITVNETLTFVDGQSYNIAFRDLKGGMSSVFAVENALSSNETNKIRLTGSWTYTYNTDTIVGTDGTDTVTWYVGSQKERTHFVFGTATDWARYGIVTSLKANNDNTVEITMMIEDNRVHDD